MNDKQAKKQEARQARREAAKVAAELAANTTPNPEELLGGTPPETPEPENEAPETPETPETPAEAQAEAIRTIVAEAEPENETPQTPEPENETPEAPKPVLTIDEMVAQMPESIRDQAREQLEKLQGQAQKNEAAKLWVDFDKAMRDGLPKFLEELAVSHKVELAGRVFKIEYPDGKFAYSNAAKGTRSGNGSGGSGGRTGFSSHGKVLAIMPDSREESFDSLNAFAKAKGYKYEGRATATIAIEDPWEKDKDDSGNYPRFPYRHSIEKREDGVQVVRRIARD